MDFKVNFDLGISKLTRELSKISGDFSSVTKNASSAASRVATDFSRSFSTISRDSSRTASMMTGDFARAAASISASMRNTFSGGGGIASMIKNGILIGAGMSIFNGLKNLFSLPGHVVSGWLEDSMEFTAVNRKFDIVFGELRGKAQSFSEEFAKSINGSTTDTKAMMARFQDTLVPMGFSRGKSFEMSRAMTQLATDLAASEPGITTGDAAARLQSALVGNHEAVRIFGVALAESSLKAKLLEMGIKGGIEKATEQEKALARLNIIIEGTRDAHGSAARASADLRQQLGGFNAVFTETSARMGNIFAPALAQVVAYFKDLGVVINTSLGSSEEWGKSLGEAMKNILGLAGGLKDQIKDLSSGFAVFVSSMANGLVNATRDWGSFKEKFGELFDRATVMLAPFFIDIERKYLTAFAGLGGALVGLFDSTGDSIKSTITSIADMLYAVVRSIETAIRRVREMGSPAFEIARAGAESRVRSESNRVAVYDSTFKDEVYRNERKTKGISLEEQVERRLQAQIDNELVAIRKQFGMKEDTSASDAVKKAKDEIAGTGDKAKTLGERMAEFAAMLAKNTQAGADAFKGSKWGTDLDKAYDDAVAAKTAAGEIKKEAIAEEKAKSKGIDTAKLFGGFGALIAGAVVDPDAKKKSKIRDMEIWQDVVKNRGESDYTPEQEKEQARRVEERNRRIRRMDRAADYRAKKAAMGEMPASDSGPLWLNEFTKSEIEANKAASEKRSKMKLKYPVQNTALETENATKNILAIGERIKTFTANLSSGGISGAISTIKADKRSSAQIEIDKQTTALQKRIKALTHGGGVDFTTSEDLHKRMQTAISNPKEELELARSQLKRLEELKNEAPKTTQALNNLPGEIAKNLAKYIGYST